DIAPPAESPLIGKLKTAINRDVATPIIVAGSTFAPEDALLLKSFSAVLRKYPRATLVLAPRKPERFEKLAAEVRAAGFPCIRRSHWNEEGINGAVFLLDSIGELGAVYAMADIAFVGGSLVEQGGHNVLEPAQFGVPIVIGPSFEN